MYSVLFCHAAAAQQPTAKSALVVLRDLVPSNHKLAEQDLSFDTSFARQAIEYLRSNDPHLMERMADSPAITHILNHARNFNYDVPKESRTALVKSLLGPQSAQAGRSAICARSLEYFAGPMLSDPHWINDALAYLPADFRFRGTLFLTFGYDIGVALLLTHPLIALTRVSTLTPQSCSITQSTNCIMWASWIIKSRRKWLTLRLVRTC